MKKFILTCLTSLSYYNSNASNLDTLDTYLNLNLGFAAVETWWSASTALTLNGGYQFNQYLATEAGFTWIYPTAVNYPSSPGSYNQTQSFMDLAAKGSLPFSNVFNAYLKGGIGAGFSGTSDPGFNSSSGISPGIFLAMGGEFHLSPHFEINIEDYGLMVFGNNNYGNINILAGGVSYRF
jgi:hypothetical protein